jgi:polar amino acid transport system substrate-binding protein
MIRAVLISLFVSAAAQAETVRIGTETSFAPYVFRNDQGEIDGLDRELADTLCRRAKLSCEWIEMEFDKLIGAVASGKIETAIGGIAATAARAEIVEFGIPYTTDSINRGMFAGLPGAETDLNLAKIAVQSGTIHHQRLIETERDVKAFATNEAAFEAVRKGTADLVFGAELYVEQALITTHRDLQVMGGDSVKGGDSAMAFAKGNDSLRFKFDDAMRSMINDGSLNRLLDKWFPIEDQT